MEKKKSRIQRKKLQHAGIIGRSSQGLKRSNTIPNFFSKLTNNKYGKASRKLLESKLALSSIAKPRFESTPQKPPSTNTKCSSDTDCEILEENITPIRPSSCRYIGQCNEQSLLKYSPVSRKLLTLDESFLKSLDWEEIEKNSSGIASGITSGSIPVIASGSTTGIPSGSTSGIASGKTSGIATLSNSNLISTASDVDEEGAESLGSPCQMNIITVADVHCVPQSDNYGEKCSDANLSNGNPPEERKRPSPQNNRTPHVSGKKFKITDDTASNSSEKHPPNGLNKIRVSKNLTPLGMDEFPTFFGLPQRVEAFIKKYKGISKLYGWQEECLKHKAVEQRKNLIYVLPTNGGKTLVAEILIFRELLCCEKNVLFILPNVSIVQEKVCSLSRFALDLGFLVEEYAAGNGCYPPRKHRHKQSVYIATIEKAHSLINSLIETNRLSEIGLVVVDELHLLGEERRGAALECLLTKLLFCSDTVHIVGMSAAVGNLEELANFLHADVYCNDFCPVELKEYVKCEETLWAVNDRGDEILSEARKITPQETPSVRKIDTDGIFLLVMEVVPKHSCLVFCATKENCESVASMLAGAMSSSLHDMRKGERKALLSALSYEGKGQVCPILQKCIPYGVVYHHAGLTSAERKLIEEAYHTGILYCICCTSTSAAGVNLLAKRVILRSPYVGGDFISLSQYKQMVGQAGRAGFDSTGESIVVCKTRDEVQQVRTLLCSHIDSVDSKLNSPAIQSLVLCAIGLGIATTRLELHKLMSCSLLFIQHKKKKVNPLELVDSTIKDLLTSKFLRIQVQNASFPSLNEVHLNCSGNCLSDLSINVSLLEKRRSSSVGQKRKTLITRNTVMTISHLGTACIKGSIDVARAYELHNDLRVAQSQCVLLSYLHLLYIVTPYDVFDMTKLLPEVYCQSYFDLDDNDRSTAHALGITGMELLRKGEKSNTIPDGVFCRFYVTLLLNDLWKNNSVWHVAQKYSVSRGDVETLMTSASSFASCLLHFCEVMSEFWGVKQLLRGFVEHLSHCCSSELLPLMDVPAVKLGRARQLYNAGYTTLKEVASADENLLVQSIEHLPRRVAGQIIAAAKFQLHKKAENLREEAEDVIEGL